MRVDGFTNSAQINMQTTNGLILSDLTSRLSPGDVVRAQVLEMFANEVLLKLFDSTTVKASVPDDFDAEVGKFKNFLVKESLSDKLVLEEQKSIPQKTQTENEDVLKALAKLGISNTEGNVKLARTILENKLPLTFEFFNNTAKLINSSKEIDILKAIFMEANKIAASPAAIKQLALLEKGSVMLGEQLNELVALLENNENEVSLPEKINQTNQAGQENAKAHDLQSSNASKGNTAQADSKAVPQENLGATRNPQVIAEDESTFDAKSFLKLVEESLKPKEELTAKAGFKEQFIVSETLSDKADVEKSDKQAASNSGKVDEPQRANDKIVKELKNEIEKLFIKLDAASGGKDFELEKNIKTMAEKLEHVREEINSLNTGSKEAILQKVDNILNQLRFINDVRSFGYYVPIPLKLNGVLEQADLYVLKRNKNKKVNPEDATIFLALDTSNMGRIETLLTVNKKSVSMNMRIEAKEYEDFIRTRFVDLYNLLAAKGYKLTDIKYRQLIEPVNAFNVSKVANELLDSNASGLDIRL